MEKINNINATLHCISISIWNESNLSFRLDASFDFNLTDISRFYVTLENLKAGTLPFKVLLARRCVRRWLAQSAKFTPSPGLRPKNRQEMQSDYALRSINKRSDGDTIKLAKPNSSYRYFILCNQEIRQSKQARYHHHIIAEYSPDFRASYDPAKNPIFLRRTFVWLL